MKKIKMIMTVIGVLLLTGLFVISCSDNDPSQQNEENEFAGKILILQAYGSSDSAAGATHSFIELYNITDTAINLNGLFIYYAAGERGSDVTEDNAWEQLALTGTIPAKGSFLILGPKQNNTPPGTTGASRYQIEDNYGDINDLFFKLSNRSFKAALIKGSVNLTNIANPFDIDGNGTKIKGYVDMVGAVNDPSHATYPDNIFGFETAPARCSASEAVRRKNLIDTDNNQNDFERIRYAVGGISDDLLELRKPRNAKDKPSGWNPFPSEEIENPTVTGDKSEYAGKLLILQAGAATDGAITRSFVELYNNTDAAIDLNTFSLQYGTTGTDWTVINLTGSVPAKSSYLIRGPLGTTHEDNRLYIENADQTVDTFILSNNGFKVALMGNQNKLTVENPFAMTGGTAADYIDLLGAYNNNASSVDAFETTVFTSISKQAAARRKSLTDSDNNQTDFERIDYRTSSGVSDTKFAQVKPRYSEDGEWEPIPEINTDWPTGTPKLMILQANTFGNANNSTDGSGFPRSLVELYNNTNVTIDLTADNYYLHIGNATNWTYAIKLTGSIPAKCSFLIVDNTIPEVTGGSGNMNATPRAPLPVADQSYNFIISNDGFKIALLRNQAALSVDNPFTEAGLSSDYIDMLGVGTAAQNTNGYETARFANQGRPQVPRRINLDDTDNNSEDFKSVDYRNTNPISNEALLKVWPRNSAAGKWNPMTGDLVE